MKSRHVRVLILVGCVALVMAGYVGSGKYQIDDRQEHSAEVRIHVARYE